MFNINSINQRFAALALAAMIFVGQPLIGEESIQGKIQKVKRQFYVTTGQVGQLYISQGQGQGLAQSPLRYASNNDSFVNPFRTATPSQVCQGEPLTAYYNVFTYTKDDVEFLRLGYVEAYINGVPQPNGDTSPNVRYPRYADLNDYPDFWGYHVGIPYILGSENFAPGVYDIEVNFGIEGLGLLFFNSNTFEVIVCSE